MHRPSTGRLTGVIAVGALLTLSVAVAGPASALPLPVAQISVVAGTGNAGLPTPGPATSSDLNYAGAVAVTDDGTIYIADSYNSLVEKVDTDGTLSIIAGTGTAGAPTPGPATSSDLNYPYGIAVADDGTVYVSDTYNNVVEKITTDGTLSIVAGTGTAGTPTPGPATASALNEAEGIALDGAGNLYIADYLNNVVEKVTPDGTLSIVAGTGTYGAPTEGPATESDLAYPAGVVVDDDGNLYIADYYNNVVEKVTPDGTLSIVAGTGSGGSPTPGPATASDLDRPTGVAVDGRGNLFIVNYYGNTVLKVTPEGELSVLAGTGEDGSPTPGPASDSELYYPYGIAATFDGYVYVADYYNSTIDLLTQPLPPTQPLNVEAVEGDGQVSVSWDEPEFDGQFPVTTYNVQASVGGSPVADKTCTIATPFTPPLTCDVTGLANGTSYTLTVTAINDVGASDPGTSGAVTPLGVPSAPLNVVALPGSAAATVFWDQPTSDGGSPITSYTVQALLDGTPVAAATCELDSPFTPPLTCAVTGLTNGTAYTFIVVANSEVGEGAASEPSGPVTPVAAPGPPVDVTATWGDGQVSVGWPPPISDGGSPITSYTVQAYDVDGPLKGTMCTLAAPFTPPLTCTVTGLENGTQYTFTATATNEIGDSDESAATSPVIPATVPDPPTGVTATAGAGQAAVTWSGPVSDGGSPITSYTVQAAVAGSPVPGATCTVSAPFSTPLTCSVTGLTNGTGYTFSVTATNAAGISEQSAASAPVTPVSVPAAPTDVTAAAGNGQATVTWAAPQSDGGSPITSYVVQAFSAGVAIPGASCTVTAPFGSPLSCVVLGLPNGTEVTFVVSAVNALGGSAGSAASSPVTPSASVTPTVTPTTDTVIVAQVVAATVSPTSGALAYTGANVLTGLTVAGIFLGGGILLLLVVRRRHAHD